jgi:23S rRNA G2069 N7-methylase RlmK/C1962 C5-methylase RlmI
MLANRVRKNQRRLRSWLKAQKVSCYRVYDKDIPELPLAVDWYEGRLHVAEYARPGAPQRAPEEQGRWLDTVLNILARALDVDDNHVYLKRRERQPGRRQYERMDDRDQTMVVHEGECQFLVNLSDYVDTGLFLDHRLTRRRVGAEAQGKSVLNLFAYTGSFSVYAARGGARSTTTVDLSRTYLEWARRNLELNGFEAPSSTHRLVAADVFSFLGQARDRGWRYDLVVVDPPTFSNSKRMSGHFDVQRHHSDLLNGVMGLVRPGGVVYFSTNARRFRLDEAALPVGSVTEISEQTVSPDFRNKKVHRCFRLLPR